MLDLEPQGPLPAQIYWRRRGLAIGIIVVVIIMITVIVAGIVRTGSRHQHDASSPSTSAILPATQQSATPEESQQIPVPAELAPVLGGAPMAVLPPPPIHDGDECPDSTLAVKGITSKPQYFVGEQPQFTMVVTNIGLVSCKRDVGAAVLAAYVYTLDNQRVWSNLDCAPSNETLVKTFKPGDQVSASVTWTGMGSVPQCPLPRQQIGAGTYALVIQLGNLRSSAVPFILVEPPQPAELPQGEETPAP